MQFSRRNKPEDFFKTNRPEGQQILRRVLYEKKVVSALLCATMVATMFAGCGSKESDNNASTPDTSKADTSSEVSEPAEDTGKVLNIYCWNEELRAVLPLTIRIIRK